MDETRNILLTILAMEKHPEDHSYYIKELLDHYSLELNDQLKEVKRQEERIKQNIELLEHVKKEVC